MLHSRGAGVQWLSKLLHDDLAVLRGPLAGFEAWGSILWQAHQGETAKRGGDAWWSSHNEGKHRFYSGAAFMEAISNPENMRTVDFAAQVLAPLALRAALTKGGQCERSRHTSRHNALARARACKSAEQQLLLLLAVRMFSPKLLISQTPEVYALILAMESLVGKLLATVSVHTTHSSSPRPLSDAELRGVTSAFLSFPLSPAARAQGYNAMDKGRNFLQW